LARRPKETSAADLYDRSAARSGGLDQRGSESAGAEAPRAVAANATDSKSALSDRLAALPTLDLGDLRLEWRRLYRADPPRLSRDVMMRAIAYRLQEIAHGGLSKLTQRRLMTLAREFETSGTIAPSQGPRIKPGSRLVREWHGRTHVVTVSDLGFEFEGKAYKSLTKIAQDITGAQWSGPRFFGLTKPPSAGTTKEASGNGLMIAESANG
jgi:Protein of unknown function (DUF2924)